MDNLYIPISFLRKTRNNYNYTAKNFCRIGCKVFGMFYLIEVSRGCAAWIEPGISEQQTNSILPIKKLIQLVPARNLFYCPWKMSSPQYSAPSAQNVSSTLDEQCSLVLHGVCFARVMLSFWSEYQYARRDILCATGVAL